jgi:hypothetical protein
MLITRHSQHPLMATPSARIRYHVGWSRGDSRWEITWYRPSYNPGKCCATTPREPRHEPTIATRRRPSGYFDAWPWRVSVYGIIGGHGAWNMPMARASRPGAARDVPGVDVSTALRVTARDADVWTAEGLRETARSGARAAADRRWRARWRPGTVPRRGSTRPHRSGRSPDPRSRVPGP